MWTYTAKHKAAQEAQDACARIVVLAEKKIGQEIIAAQQRGELARPGDQDRARDNVPDGNVIPATFDDIGITRRQAFEFRQMAALSDEDIVEVMAEAKDRGSPVRKADFKRKVEAKRPAPNSLPPRPEHLITLSLLLKNLGNVVPQFMDHREAISLASRHGIEFDPEQVRSLVEFLASLLAGLEADRPA